MNREQIEKLNEEMQRDLEELNEHETKVKEQLEKTNHDKEIIKNLEKHLSKDEPEIVFYNKIKYRGSSLIGLNFSESKYQNRYYSRRKIDEIGNKISKFLQEEGVQGRLSNSLLFPFGWKSGFFSDIGDDVSLANVERYLEFYEEPKTYKKFQFYLTLKPKAEGGNDYNNDCLYNCLHLYLFDRLPWKTPEELKKYLKLKRKDKVPITCIKKVEERLKTYAINIRGDYIYSSTIQSNKVINLVLSDEHYTIDRNVDNCKCKDISYTQKIPLLYDKKANIYFDGIETVTPPKLKQNPKYSKYVLVIRDNYKVSIQEEYEQYINSADALYEATSGTVDLRKGNIKTSALNLFDRFTKFLMNPESILQDEASWISESNSGAIVASEKYEGPAYKYDIKSMYPSILMKPLKFPIKRGEFKILNTDDFEKMVHFQFGIYRVRIEKSDELKTNKLFRFNKYNKYTHTTLEHAKLLNLKMTLIQDETPNFLSYSSDKVIGCNEIFTTYIDYLFKLKENKVPKAKLLLNIIWGGLCEVDKKKMVYKNKDINIGSDCEFYSITPNDKNENILHIVTTNQNKYYKTGFARLSPFLISKGRQIISTICYPHRENIKWIHTDGFISDISLDVKTGENIGDLVKEGFCENVVIENCLNVTGIFKI